MGKKRSADDSIERKSTKFYINNKKITKFCFFLQKKKNPTYKARDLD